MGVLIMTYHDVVYSDWGTAFYGMGLIWETNINVVVYVVYENVCIVWVYKYGSTS